MRQFKTVFKFEFTNMLRSKVFIVLTLVLVVIIAVVMSLGSIKTLFSGGASQNAESGAQGAASSGGAAYAVADETLAAFLPAALPQYVFVAFDGGEEALTNAVKDGTYAGGILLTGENSYKLVVQSLGMYDSVQYEIDSALASYQKLNRMEQLGLTAEEASDVLAAGMQQELVQLGKDQAGSFFYTYILILMLYMAIMMYGQMVASGVAAEKSSRTTEMLITSAKPTNLIFGKVLGIGSAGLLQFAVIFGAAVVFYKINFSSLGEIALLSSFMSIDPTALLLTIVFFVLGYLIYSFLFGALGSLASRPEDVSVLITPVMLIYVAAFVIVIIGMTSGNVDSMLMKVCSFIPFTSPMAMLARFTMGSVSTVSVVISIVILVGWAYICGMLSGKIYKVGVLRYSKPPKMKELFRMLRAAK